MRLIATDVMDGVTGTAEVIDGKPVLAGRLMEDMGHYREEDPVTGVWVRSPADAGPDAWLRVMSLAFRSAHYRVTWEDDDGSPSELGPWKGHVARSE